MKTPERRYVRQRLQAPVSFSWRDKRGIRHLHHATTRDLSPAGFFLLSRSCPPVGTPIGVNVLLPPFADNMPRWQMQARGRVVRVESNEGRTTPGFAAVSEKLVVRVLENVA